MDDRVGGWRKSSLSGGNGGECVEVGHGQDVIAVRDTKQAGRGPVLTVNPSVWLSFTAKVKVGAR
jgi:hypothetical protein